MENFQSEILTVEEAAALLKIPRSSVYTLAQKGKIPAQKVGRHWRFRREAIDRWLEAYSSTSNDDRDAILD